MKFRVEKSSGAAIVLISRELYMLVGSTPDECCREIQQSAMSNYHISNGAIPQ